ncbi:MAG: RES family NAD+ phosphorylase [Halomonas sp.]|uniref:RES family NAD+ phosphorylase n=1 Tax=Halomonas sp. TaxID=1486246 RepID=UPI002ACE5859|nr:RES family NAD+ phosphorylase [Halomonas sp.]MDZ7852781.1 RES family NAD+ phosphorylase [Halomonas sp.]
MAHLELQGSLGYRWHPSVRALAPAGRPVVYLADCPATALLEVLVHFELGLDELPEAFTLLRVELPDDVDVRDTCDDLPPEWSDDLTTTRRIGDTWLNETETLLLRVPTVIVPHNCNYLFNPFTPMPPEPS